MTTNNYIIEITYRLVEEYCDVYQQPLFEYEDFNIISLSNSVGDHTQSFYDLHQEWINNSATVKHELGVDYKLVLSVKEVYTKDYWGEVDMEDEVETLFSGVLNEDKPDPCFDTWITLKEGNYE